MTIITYLSEILSKRINISPIASRGLLKLSIQDELGPFIDFYTINFQGLKASIENALKKRLINLKIENLDEVIELLISELKTNQSLMTMDKF
ncbi:MAG: hypothetical protein ACFFAS_05605 [Promethearchaeota archaeon]